MRVRGRHLIFFLCSSVLLATGCTIGPRLLYVDRLRYNRAVRETSNEEMLLNLVRLRYFEAPQFLGVGSITATYGLDAMANARGEFKSANPSLGVVGGMLDFTEKPAITLTPLVGAELYRHLLTPFQADVIHLLTNTGWDINRVLRVTVQNMNGLDNASNLLSEEGIDFHNFASVTREMAREQQMGLLSIGYRETEEPVSEAITLEKTKDLSGADLLAASKENRIFRKFLDEKVQDKDKQKKAQDNDQKQTVQDTQKNYVLKKKERSLAVIAKHDFRFRQLKTAGLSPDLEIMTPDAKILLYDKGLKEEPLTLKLKTRNVLAALIYASKAVAVPPEHVEQGLVRIPTDKSNQEFDWQEMLGDLMQIHSQKRKPHNAYVAVHYRDYWFYIDNADLESKATFGLIQELFSLQVSVPPVSPPSLTLPIGK